MLNIMKIKLYPFFTKLVSIPVNEDKAYNIIFLSENEDFVTVYPKLNIRRQFAKKITYLASKVPRIIPVMKNLTEYRKKLGLLPILKPDNTNVFIDTTPFMNKLDETYNKASYQRPVVLTKIISYLTDAKRFGNQKSIFLYHVNLSKEIPQQFINRRAAILAMIAKVGNGTFPFDNVVLAIEEDGSIKFTSIYNQSMKPYDFGKILSILKRLTPKGDEIEPEPEQQPEKIEEPKIQHVPEESISDIIRDENELEKQSILNAIAKYQKNRLVTS